MASEKEAVMVTVSDPERKLSVSVSVRLTLSLEFHTPSGVWKHHFSK